MRLTAVTALALIAAAFLASAAAPVRAQGYDYPWCTSGGWSTDNTCKFQTFEQCLAFVQGVGGSCTRNPRSTLPPDQPPPARQRRQAR